jgi:hypothetical protein
VVADQFVSHLNRNDLYVPVQSAYRAFHSGETSLIRVLNDLGENGVNVDKIFLFAIFLVVFTFS